MFVTHTETGICYSPFYSYCMRLGKYARMVTDLEPNKGTKNILEFDSANFIFTPVCFCWCSWSL